MATIGICGPSGSGKTSISKLLCADIDAVRMNLDNYFLFDPPVKKYEKKGHNWELPENLDWIRIRHELRALKNRTGNTLTKIDWDTLAYIEEVVEPKPHVVVEGFLLLHDEELVSMMDFTVYIDVPDQVGLARRHERDSDKRDYEANKKWFEEVTFPEYAPRRKVFEERADMVLNGELPIADNLERVRTALDERSLLERSL